MRTGFVIDLEKCIGCRSCTVSCKMHNAIPPKMWWNRVFTPGSADHLIAPEEGVEYFLPVTCQHCQNAPCVKVCPVGATFHSTDGTVQMDYERCIGCRYCMTACPYGVRQFNWEDPKDAHKRVEYQEGYAYGDQKEHRRDNRLVYTPVRPKGVVEKCSLCVQNRDKGKLPACVTGCPGNARYVGDLDDPSSEVSKLIREREGFTLLPEKGTKPNTYYLTPGRKKGAKP